ncbi:hypothetical protein [Fibrella aquatica]
MLSLAATGLGTNEKAETAATVSAGTNKVRQPNRRPDPFIT